MLIVIFFLCIVSLVFLLLSRGQARTLWTVVFLGLVAMLLFTTLPQML